MDSFILSGKILLGLGWEIVYFPLWWYSGGFLAALRSLKNFLADKEKSLALSVWIKNIFRPMYGQHDWAGVLISFVVRFFQIIARSLVLLFWTLLSLVVLACWLVAPVLAIYEILIQLI